MNPTAVTALTGIINTLRGNIKTQAQAELFPDGTKHNPVANAVLHNLVMSLPVGIRAKVAEELGIDHTE